MCPSEPFSVYWIVKVLVFNCIAYNGLFNSPWRGSESSINTLNLDEKAPKWLLFFYLTLHAWIVHLDTHEINWHGCWIWTIYNMCWIKVFKNNNIFTFKWKLLVIELLPNLGGWYTLSDIWDKCIGYLRLLWLLKPVKLWKGRCLVMITFKLCLIHFLRNFGYKMLVHLFVLVYLVIWISKIRAMLE